MNTLRTAQILMAVLACTGFWYAYKRYESANACVVIFAIVCSVVMLLATQTLPVIWLNSRGATVMATVVRVDCAQGQKHYVYFEFPVGGTPFRAFDSDSYGERKCDVLKPGDREQIVYIPTVPEVHAWGDVRVRLFEHLLMLAFASIAVGVMTYAHVRRDALA